MQAAYAATNAARTLNNSETIPRGTFRKDTELIVLVAVHFLFVNCFEDFCAALHGGLCERFAATQLF